MSGNVILSARSGFIILNYLSHMMQRQTWEESAVSAHTDVGSAFFVRGTHKDSGCDQEGRGPGCTPALPFYPPSPQHPELTGC